MTITSREERLQRSPGPSLSGDSDHINYAKVVFLSVVIKNPELVFQINYAKVVILGAMGVGKTALIKVRKIRKIMNHQSSSSCFQRFMSNVFDPHHVPTVARSDYYPSLVYDCSIVEVKDNPV